MREKPDWLKVRYNQEAVDEVAELMRDRKLNTVCRRPTVPTWGVLTEEHRHVYDPGKRRTRNCRSATSPLDGPCRRTRRSPRTSPGRPGG